MGKLSRTKGHSFERQVAIDFREIGYPNARRHLEYQDAEANGIDLVNTGEFKIQCKSKQGYASVNTIDEIQAGADDIPLLLTKANNKPVMAIMEWKHLKNILHLLSKTANGKG